MKRKAISIILALCLLLTMAPMAMADEGNGTITTFEQLKTAFENGGTYTLGNDITVTEGLTLQKDAALTINGNSHIIRPTQTGLNEQGIVNKDATKIDSIITNKGNLTLKNLTVYGGKGRAVDNRGSLAMEKVSLERAYGTDYGAGLYNAGAAKALLTDCNIRRNANMTSGGGFYNIGTLIMERCAVVENRNFGNSNGGGGGENSGSGKLYMNNCTVANNQSIENGGGLNLYLSTSTAYIMNTTVTGNVTTAGKNDGGGIGCNGATLYAVNSVFAYNYSSNTNELSDIGLYSSVDKVHLYNCAYTAVCGSEENKTNFSKNNSTANNKELVNEGTTLAVTAVFNASTDTPILGKDGKALSTSFARPSIIKLSNGTYGVYPNKNCELLRESVNTYFEVQESAVKMAYGSPAVSLGDLTAATTEVTNFQDNTNRTPNTIGALPAKDGAVVKSYNVTVNAVEHGTVTGGNVLGDSYVEGERVTLTAVPAENYKFVKWTVTTDNDTSDETANPYTFTVTQDVTVTPVFEESNSDSKPEPKPSSSGTIVNPAYDVLVGTVDNGLLLSDYAMAKAGTVVTITAKAASGYEVQAVTVKDKDNNAVTVTAKDGKYTFTMPKSSVNVSASFVKAEDEKGDTVKDNQGTSKLTIIMQIGSTDILVNGKHLANDVAPVIVSNRTLVPIRVVTETLGGTAEWDAKDKTVTLNIDGKTIEMTVGVTLEKYGVAPVIMNDRTYVPIRFVAEELGATVDWTAETQTITITK